MFERFITRQPILKDNLSLLGYDVRFRPEKNGNGGEANADAVHAGALLMDAATMVFHWETVVGQRLAFVELGAQEVLSGAALVLPRARTVIQLPAATTPSRELLLACQGLKAAGYRLALSRWNGTGDTGPLAAVADFVRLDLRRAAMPDEPPGAAAGGAIVIAHNVDTWEEHQKARALGLRHFQGDFFLRPQTFRRRAITGSRQSALRLLQAVLRSPLDLGAIEEIVREEPALTYKLLRYLNSPAMERQVEVRSIRSAIGLLGEQEFRRWASLVAVATPATDKPDELLRTGLMRAYFCEQLALRRDAAHAYEYFFTGLFSVMDAVLDRPLSEIVEELALSRDVRRALRGETGELREALTAAIGYEHGDWAALRRAMQVLSLPEAAAPDCFDAAGRSVAAILQ
ncbi:MAG TPA: HDOD domain-containing protein [Dongiaceae bacterium]|nr:HDOD domain-containing protein [Dongiaceae bacterium]